MSSRSLAPLAVVVLLGAVAAQTGGGRFYAFDDRKPQTKLEQTVDRLLDSVVKVHGASGLKTIQSYASGILVSDKGHVITLDQVLIQPDSTKVVLRDGTVCECEVYPADQELGVRMLKIVDADLKRLKTPLVPLAIPEKQDHRNGTFVVSIGNCFRLAEFSEKMSATFGVIVSRMRTGLRYMLAEVDYAAELIVTDAPNNPGHYGGGLFTLDGEWIGLNTKIVESTETNSQVSAAIPTSDLQEYIGRCIELGPLGAMADDDEPEVVVPVHHGIALFDHGRRVSPPAYVERIDRTSPAREAGLRPDDLIVRIDRHTVRSCNGFYRLLKKYKPGDTVTVTFKRGTEVLQAKLTFAEAGK